MHKRQPAPHTSITSAQPDTIKRQRQACPSRPGCRTWAHTPFKVTTQSARAQLFINQGVNLAYGFNHAEAARAFAEAARLDPNCAMAYWGQALVLGPNINAPMDPKDEPTAFELVQKARNLKPKTSRREQAYIDALSVRYTGKPEDRQRADRGFAEAMRKLVASYPTDLDAKTIYAESLMDLRPWNYWTRDGQPYAETRDVQAMLERSWRATRIIRARCTFWIHLWEPPIRPSAPRPKQTGSAADARRRPYRAHARSHLHARRPSRRRRESNQLAAKADEDYIAQCRAQGLYPLGYYPHNLHFIWMGASASGQKQLAVDAATKVANAIRARPLARFPSSRDSWSCRIGRWSASVCGPRSSRTKGRRMKRHSPAACGATPARWP